MRVLIITTDRFPRGNAGATRQEIFTKILSENGFDVDVIGLGEFTNYEWRYLFQNVRYISLREKKQNLICRLKARLLFSYNVKKIMEFETKYDSILIESVPFSIIRYVKKYHKKNGTVIIHDSVEWYSAAEFKLGIFSPSYILKNLNNRFWIGKEFKIIAISNYLKEYFLKKGCQTIRIPFIYDVVGQGNVKKEKNSKIRFQYAGMIGNKDHVKNFLEVIYKLDNSLKDKIEVHFFGFDKTYLIKTQNISSRLIDELDGVITFHGRVSRETVENELKKTTFTILFRNPNERYAKAGFPTKVVESLSHSTPMFCNYSSDLDLYLENMKNSIICLGESKEDISLALNNVFKLTEENINYLQEIAYKTALENFDYRTYSEKVITFFRDK